MIKKWLATTAGKAILIGVALGLVALLLLMSTCKQAATERTKADLAASQAGAQSASGRDAVQTLGNSVADDATIDRTTTENHNAIESAPHTAVAPDMRAAGLHALCQRPRYRAANPACVQHATP